MDAETCWQVNHQQRSATPFAVIEGAIRYRYEEEIGHEAFRFHDDHGRLVMYAAGSRGGACAGNREIVAGFTLSRNHGELRLRGLWLRVAGLRSAGL